MACDECRDLGTHAFRSPDDLIHAIRVAAEEMGRGVLRQEAVETRGPAEEEAMASVLSSGAFPAVIHYRFRCAVCGDRFTLDADTGDGSGGWTREPAT